MNTCFSPSVDDSKSETQWKGCLKVVEGGTFQRNTALPRISETLSFQELYEEAVARGFSKKRIPITKAALLDVLLVGSIHLKETAAWKQVQKLKERIAEERPELVKQIMKQNASNDSSIFDPSEGDDENQHDQANVSHGTPATGSKKKVGTASVACFACGSEKGVDDEDIVVSGASMNTQEDNMEEVIARRSAQKDKMVEQKMKELAVDEKMREQHEQWMIEEEYRRRMDEEEMRRQDEMAMMDKWNCEEQFPKCILTPSPRNKRPNGNSSKGFTVWCSFESTDIYGYREVSRRMFDTTYKTPDDANERGRYLFLWNNPWRINPWELMEERHGRSSITYNVGLKSFWYQHYDSAIWIVSVVPDSTFKKLDFSTNKRHQFDKGLEKGQKS